MPENSEMQDWNATVVRQFHAGEEKLGGMFGRDALLLLTTTGAKSGQSRVSPLAYLPYENDLLVVGSAGGSDRHPAWYFNLLAHPEVQVERWHQDVLETFKARARAVSEGDEHAELWRFVTERAPGFANYQANTDRVIPVVRLTRV